MLIAGINYVNLMTARGAQRAVEVGVRKSFGARRWDLVLQFMLESVGAVAIAALDRDGACRALAFACERAAAGGNSPDVLA